MDKKTENFTKKSASSDNLIECGYFSCETVYNQSEAISHMKVSDSFVICFVVSGEGIHRVLNQEIPCENGDICVLSPLTPHGFFIPDEKGSLTVRQIKLDLPKWLPVENRDPEREDYCFGIFDGNSKIAYATLNSFMRSRLFLLFDLVEDEVLERKKDWRQLVSGYIVNLLISIGRYVDSAIKNSSFVTSSEWQGALRILSIINEEYSDSALTLDIISSRLFVSKSVLSRVFKKAMGVTFSDYLMEMRMKKVTEGLIYTDFSASKIANLSGFHNMASFYKQFTARYKTTPGEYRASFKNGTEEPDDYKKLLKEERIMSILNEISENLQKGKSKMVKELVAKAIEEGVKPADILEQGLIAGMSVVGEKFKNNEVYVPEVLVAARAMNMGSEILKPYLTAEDVKCPGKVCIGTVRGDLHDIGKNLVKMMMEGKGLEVIDLGTDVPPEAFVKCAIEENCKIICCSALLTTTMGEMEAVVKEAEAQGIRDKVKIMIGGAPASQEYCDRIGADSYSPDAASAADTAVAFCLE